MKAFLIRWCLLSFVVFCALAAMACGAAQLSGSLGELIVISQGIGGILAAAGSAIFPGEAAAISAANAMLTTGLKTAKSLVDNYHANPSDGTLGSAVAALNDAHQNVAQLETAAQIKDPKTKAKLQALVDSTQAALAMIEAQLHATHAGTMANAHAS